MGACTEPPQGRRTVLLTHHQLKSRHHHVGGNLATRLGAVLADPGVDAWIWGHEHLCMKFAPRAQLRYALCAGHGALPQAVGGGNAEPGGWEYDAGHQDGNRHTWRLCGYVVLDLDGKQNTVRYVDERGNTHHSPDVV